MDLSFTPEETAFRHEMRSFFHHHIPASIREHVQKGEHVHRHEQVEAQRILNAHGLAVPHWPAEWGGRDWSPVQLYIYQDEMQMACVPPPLSFNANMVGPVLAQFGSDEQKRRFLPATANLDIWWCQGFSEPGAGSDLASLRTSAVRDGDQLRRQRPEDVDDAGAVCRLDFLPVPDRHRRSRSRKASASS